MTRTSIFSALSAFAAATAVSLSGVAVAELRGTVRVDGSSTVFPITEGMAEDFQKENRNVRVTVGVSGTGGGMKKFLAGETDISGASRPIHESERKKALENGIAFIEFPVAYDGIAVVVSRKNKFVDAMTVDELKRIWQPDSTVKYWSDVRPSWPKREMKLYAPGADSGTFEYFTEVIVGKARATRRDFTASEDDNVLVRGVAGDEYAMGYFGFAYYVENQDSLKVVAVDAGAGPVAPSQKTIENTTYAPLSRPVFLYVSQSSATKPEVEAFVRYYIDNAPRIVPQVGYVPLASSIYKAAANRFSARMIGTLFGSVNFDRTAKMEDILKQKGE